MSRRAYVLYREKRSRERAHEPLVQPGASGVLNVLDGGVMRPLDMAALREVIVSACADLGAAVTPEPIVAETVKNLYEGVPLSQVYDSAILAARTMIEKDPAYSQVTARILLHTIRREILGEEVLQSAMTERYAEYFPQFLKRGVEAELLDEKLLQFDIKKLGAALDASRDLQFGYLGLQTLYDRYFLHSDGVRIEMPQAFFMRVAMGLSLGEINREARAIEFLQHSVAVRFHEFHADFVQCRHTAFATVVVLLDHHRRRPGRDLRRAEGKRVVVEIRGRARQ